MPESYPDFCYNLVGSYVLEYVEMFEGLSPQLSKANIDVTLPEYLSMMVVTAVLMLVTVMFGGGTILFLSMGLQGILMGFMGSIVFSVVTALMFYIYPSVIMKSRASKIRDTLPFATMYLSTLAGTGTPLPMIFKNLSEVDEYGEVAEEAEKISRDIETFGMDINKAIERAARRTPSEDFRELMWGMNHVLTTGGSLRDFLRERADKLMADYQRRIEEFSEQLSLLVEMYITLIIVGSIIFTSMSAVISSFADSDPGFIVTIQVALIFFGLPVISGMFIILVDGMSPGGVR